MPIPAGTSHAVLRGTLPGGEIWVSGFWTDHQSTSQDEANSDAEAVWAIWKNTSSGIGQVMQSHFMSQQTTMDGLSLYSYNASSSSKAAFVGESSTAGFTGTANSKDPDVTAIVVTLLTPYPGRSHRGRMYLPATGCSLDSNGLVPDPDPANLATAAAAALKASAAALGAFFPVVVSRTLGTFATINAVAVDQRPDSQRRRANRQVKGNRHLVAITYP